MPSSSIVIEPLRFGIVPSSKTVTPGAAIILPIKSLNALVFFLLKSASRPCPIASCNKIPGQPGPKTKSITPAGAGFAWRLTLAILSASEAAFCQTSGFKKLIKLLRPPIPVYPFSLRPLPSNKIDMFSLTMGLISENEEPSGRNIKIF